MEQTNHRDEKAGPLDGQSAISEQLYLLLLLALALRF